MSTQEFDFVIDALSKFGLTPASPGFDILQEGDLSEFEAGTSRRMIPVKEFAAIAYLEYVLGTIFEKSEYLLSGQIQATEKVTLDTTLCVVKNGSIRTFFAIRIPHIDTIAVPQQLVPLIGTSVQEIRSCPMYWEYHYSEEQYEKLNQMFVSQLAPAGTTLQGGLCTFFIEKISLEEYIIIEKDNDTGEKHEYSSKYPNTGELVHLRFLQISKVIKMDLKMFQSF